MRYVVQVGLGAEGIWMNLDTDWLWLYLGMQGMFSVYLG